MIYTLFFIKFFEGKNNKIWEIGSEIPFYIYMPFVSVPCTHNNYRSALRGSHLLQHDSKSIFLPYEREVLSTKNKEFYHIFSQ